MHAMQFSAQVTHAMQCIYAQVSHTMQCSVSCTGYHMLCSVYMHRYHMLCSVVSPAQDISVVSPAHAMQCIYAQVITCYAV